MTTKKPTGDQLDIPSIATALTTDASALSILDAEYARIDNANGGFVDLTSAQAVGGVKTFTSDVVLDDSSGQNPSVSFRRSGAAAGIITGVGNRLLLEFGAADLSVYDGVIVSNVSVRGADDTHANSFTTKSYQDTKFFPFAGGTISGDLTVTGDFIVSGTTTSVNTADLAIVDNVITINDGETGAGVSLSIAGIEIDRGTATNQNLIFDDVDDRWKMGETGSLVNIATEAYSDANYYSVNGGTIAGDVLIHTATPQFKIRKTTASDTTYLIFTDTSGITNFELNMSGTTDHDIRLMHRDGSTINNTFFLGKTYSSFSDDVRMVGTQGTTTSSLTRKDYVDDNFVDLTTHQVISGVKNFSEDIIVQNGTGGKVKTYATGTGLAGYSMFVDGLQYGLLYANGTSKLRLRYYDDPANGFTAGSELELGDGYMRSTVKHYGVDSTDNDSFTTRGFINSTVVDLTSDQTITGIKQFANQTRIQYDDCHLVLNATNGTTPRLYFQVDGSSVGDIQGIANRMLFRRYRADGGQNRVEIYDAYTQIDHSLNVKQISDTAAQVWINASVAGNASYLNFQHEGIVVSKLVAFTNSTNLQKVGGGTITIRDDAIEVDRQLQIKSPSGATTGASIRIEERDGFGGNSIGIFTPNSIAADYDIVLPASGGNGTLGYGLKVTYVDSGANKSYLEFVEDDSVKLTGNQDIAGSKTFTGGLTYESAAPYLNIFGDTGHNSHLQFRTAGLRTCLLYSGSVATNLVRYDNSNTSTAALSLRNDYIAVNRVLRGITPVGITDLTTKAYVDDNTNVVQQPSAFSMVMPTALPTTGQSLEVDTVVGTVVTMKWV